MTSNIDILCIIGNGFSPRLNIWDWYLKIRPCLARINCQNFDSLSQKACWAIWPLLSWTEATITIVGTKGTCWNLEPPPTMARDYESRPFFLCYFHAPPPPSLMVPRRWRSCHPYQSSSSNAPYVVYTVVGRLKSTDRPWAIAHIEREKNERERKREREIDRERVEGRKSESESTEEKEWRALLWTWLVKMEVSAGETLHRERDEKGRGIPLSPHMIGRCGQSTLLYIYIFFKNRGQIPLLPSIKWEKRQDYPSLKTGFLQAVTRCSHLFS